MSVLPVSVVTRPVGRRLAAPLAVAAAIVVVDQLTKHWALNALDDGHTIDLFWTLRFNLAFNTGMAFSQGDGLGPIIGVVALVVIVVLLVSIGRATSKVYPWAVGLIVGGAIGNLVDRLLRGDGWLRGAVVDFIDPQWFPIFNVADSAVTIGGVLLVLTSLRAEPASAPDGSTDETPVAGEAVPDGAETVEDDERAERP